MKLLHKDYGLELDVVEDSATVLVVENSIAFTQIINDLCKQSNGEVGAFSLFEGDKTKNIAKEVEFIFNPFSMSCNNKRIITKLYQELKDIALDKLQPETIELNAKLVTYIEDLTQSVPYPLNFQLDLDISAILKAYNVVLEDEYDSLLEKIVEYIKICNYICHIKTYIFVNIKFFLSEEELLNLYEFATYEKINLVLLEAVQNTKIDKEKVWILDKDLCIITL